MRIRRAEPADSEALADLHTRQIPWGLLSQLGREFVATFYGALVRSPQGFGFLAEQDGRVLGFATGVEDWRRFYRGFFRQSFGAAVRVLLRRYREIRWRRLIETTRYATSGALPRAELVSIALAPDVRGTGIGSQLVTCVLQEFSTRNVGAVRVTAKGTNVRARQLYERMGFTLHAEAEIHPGESAVIYVARLDQTTDWRPARVPQD